MYPQTPVPGLIRILQKSKNSVNELRPEKDGYLGSDFTEPLTIELVPKDGCGFVCKLVPAPVMPKCSKPRLDLELITGKVRNGETVYTKTVSVSPLLEGDFSSTRWPKNHLKIIGTGLLENQPTLYVWEIGIVTQVDRANNRANFFLTQQLARRSPICRNNLGGIVLPEWSDAGQWKSLWQHMDFLIPDQDALPLVKETPGQSGLKKTLRGNIGTVLWYNLANQIGVIALRDKEVRVYWTSIATKDRFKHLKDSQKVQVVRTGPSVNTHLSPRVTSFREDAVEVIPLS